MENELIVFEAMKEVGGAAKSLVEAYRETRVVNRAKRNILIDKLRVYQSLQRGNAIGAIGRNNIMEIKKTMDLIESLNLTGNSLTMAMRQVETLSDALNQVLEDYRHVF